MKLEIQNQFTISASQDPAFFLVNIHALQSAQIAYPPRKLWEDIEMNFRMEEVGLVVCKLQMYIHHKPYRGLRKLHNTNQRDQGLRFQPALETIVDLQRYSFARGAQIAPSLHLPLLPVAQNQVDWLTQMAQQIDHTINRLSNPSSSLRAAVIIFPSLSEDWTPGPWIEFFRALSPDIQQIYLFCRRNDLPLAIRNTTEMEYNTLLIRRRSVRFGVERIVCYFLAQNDVIEAAQPSASAVETSPRLTTLRIQLPTSLQRSDSLQRARTSPGELTGSRQKRKSRSETSPSLDQSIRDFLHRKGNDAAVNLLPRQLATEFASMHLNRAASTSSIELSSAPQEPLPPEKVIKSIIVKHRNNLRLKMQREKRRRISPLQPQDNVVTLEVDEAIDEVDDEEENEADAAVDSDTCSGQEEKKDDEHKDDDDDDASFVIVS